MACSLQTQQWPCSHDGVVVYWTWRPKYNNEPSHLPSSTSDRPQLSLLKRRYLEGAGTHLSTRIYILGRSRLG